MPGPLPGQLHVYQDRKGVFSEKHLLLAFEHAASSTNATENIILFLSGLTEGLCTLVYPAEIAQSLPDNWSLAEVQIRSSYDGMYETIQCIVSPEVAAQAGAFIPSLRTMKTWQPVFNTFAVSRSELS